MANAVGSYADLDNKADSSLLGMLAPIVMGGVAQQSGNDLSANGVAGLLASQKDNGNTACLQVSAICLAAPVF